MATEPTPNESKKVAYDPAILRDLLPVYYKRLFPHKSFYRWLSYGLSEPSVFTNREISFTIENDIYLRYLSYENQSELEKDICSRIPHKIDIGAVMTAKPKHHRISTGFQPVQRELVFDIDMTDYDDVRTCCSGAEVCQKCWKFMSVACRVLDQALRNDFGFEHILWVFSGRRGIHAWVCDKGARHLDTKGRGAVAEYLNIVTHFSTAGGGSVARVNVGEKMHHSVKRAFKVIEPMFEEVVLEDQNLFGTPEGVTKLVQIIPDETAQKELRAHLKKVEGASCKAVWDSFVRFASSMRSQANSVWSRKLKNIVEEVQLAIMYPRLDINVSKGFNHLLKAPFCIHPSTGKICTPFNPNVAGKFDPTTVPTISMLLDEINAFDDKNKDDELPPESRSRIKDYKKTGMFKGVVVFEEFLRKMESTFKTKAIEVSDATMEF